MEIYDKYIVAKDKASFIRNVNNFDERLYLWRKMSDSERRNIVSRLSISDIRCFIHSMNNVDRRDIYYYFDEMKLNGYYKILSDDEKKRMVSLVHESAVGLMLNNKKKKISSDSVTSEREDNIISTSEREDNIISTSEREDDIILKENEDVNRNVDNVTVASDNVVGRSRGNVSMGLLVGIIIFLFVLMVFIF